MGDVKERLTLNSLSVRFDAVEHKVSQNETLFQSLQASMNSFFSRLSILVAAGGLIAAAGAIVQSNRIDDQVAFQIGRVDAALAKTEPQKIISSSILNAIDDSDIMYAEPALSYRNSDGGLEIYNAVMIFTIRYSYNGTGANHINGFQVKTDKKFYDLFFKGRKSLYADSFLVGTNIQQDVVSLLPNIYYSSTFTISSSEKNCALVEARIKEILSIVDFGEIEVTPIFDVAPATSATRKFRVQSRDTDRTFDCAAIAAGQNASAEKRASSPPPQP